MTKERFIELAREAGIQCPDLYLDNFMAALKKEKTQAGNYMAAYYSEFQTVHHRRPDVPAHHPKLLKEATKEMQPDRVVMLLRAFVRMRNEWFITKDWAIDAFVQNIGVVGRFVDQGIDLTRKQITKVAEGLGQADPEAMAVDLANLILQRVALDGRTNYARARQKIGELGWDALGRERGWYDLCQTLDTKNRGTLLAQLREAIKARGQRAPERQLPDPTKKHLPEPEADPARVRAIMAQAFNKKEIP
jgi:hypothetical protein